MKIEPCHAAETIREKLCVNSEHRISRSNGTVYNYAIETNRSDPKANPTMNMKRSMSRMFLVACVAAASLAGPKAAAGSGPMAAATPVNIREWNGKPVVTTGTRLSEDQVRARNLVYLGRRYWHPPGKTGVSWLEVYGQR